MITKEIYFDGVPLIVPIISGIQMEFLKLSFEGYPSRCGAGQGLGDLIVPEKIWGLSITPSCHIHDTMWDIAEPTWADFHSSNSIFLHNILSIIQYRSSSSILEHFRNYRAMSYYNAVDTVGANIFWKLKRSE